jgi:hypothetical protein
MQQWHAEHGHPPGATDWNVAQLRRRGQHDLVDRFYASGAPHLSTVINRFGGWSTMIEAAGLPTQPSGEHHQTDKHRATMASKLAPRACDYCGREFVPARYKYAQRYCGQVCYHASHTRLKVAMMESGPTPARPTAD